MTTKTTTKKKRQPKKGDSFFRRNQLALIIAGSIIGMLLGAASALVFGRTPQTVRLTFTGRETTEAVGDTLRSRLGLASGRASIRYLARARRERRRTARKLSG